MVKAGTDKMGSSAGGFPGFNRLVRFEDNEGKVCYGDLPIDCPIVDAVGMKVPVLDGKPLDELKQSQKVTEIKKVRDIPPFSVCFISVRYFATSAALLTHRQLLCPLETTPLILCIGLNYRQHANEAGVSGS